MAILVPKGSYSWPRAISFPGNFNDDSPEGAFKKKALYLFDFCKVLRPWRHFLCWLTVTLSLSEKQYLILPTFTQKRMQFCGDLGHSVNWKLIFAQWAKWAFTKSASRIRSPQPCYLTKKMLRIAPPSLHPSLIMFLCAKCVLIHFSPLISMRCVLLPVGFYRFSYNHLTWLFIQSASIQFLLLSNISKLVVSSVFSKMHFKAFTYLYYLPNYHNIGLTINNVMRVQTLQKKIFD